MKVCPHCSALLTEPFVPLPPVLRLTYEAIRDNPTMMTKKELGERVYGEAYRSESAVENCLFNLRQRLSDVNLHIARSPFRIVNNITREVITRKNPFTLPPATPIA
jgi:DNA-binding winged helix-turn-helix (wHTH) protein